MGFSLTTVTEPEGQAEAVAQVREPLDRAIADRKALAPDDPHLIIAQDRIHRLSRDLHRAERSAFWLNIWFMGRFRRAMQTLDMAYEPAESPVWPNWSQHPLRIDLIGSALTEGLDPSAHLIQQGESEPARPDEVTLAQAYVDQETAVRRDHPPGGGAGIPLHKLRTNDSWLVTPAECRGALAAWEAAGEAERTAVLSDAEVDRDLWDEWLGYLRLAAHHGGFTVD